MDYEKYYRKPKSNDETLGEVLKRLIKAYRLEGKLHESQLKAAWEGAMGSIIARQTLDLKLEKRCLIVKMQSAAMRQDLSFSKEKVIQLVNKQLDSDYIQQIEIK